MNSRKQFLYNNSLCPNCYQRTNWI